MASAASAFFLRRLTLGLRAAALLGATATLFGQTGPVIEIDPVEAARREVVPIALVAEASARPLLERAFSVHGGYRVVAAGQQRFTFRFSPVAATTMRATVEDNTGRVLATTDVTGRDPGHAALLAADAAVSAQSATPGFFAGRLAYISDRSGSPEVYVSDLFLTNIQRVTRDNRQILGPRLSPDASTVLYTSYRSGFPAIYRHALTGQRSVVANFKGLNSGATWAPTGDRIAMVLSPQGNSEIFVQDLRTGRNVRLTNSRAIESDPTWSPDGGRVAFVSDTPGQPQLYVVEARAGATMRRVPTAVSGFNAEPNWNPRDANLIALTVAVGREFEIAVWNFGSNRSEVLTSGPGDAISPVWTNDGRHLVYVERVGAKRRLMVLDTKTRNTAPLYNQNATVGQLTQPSFVYPRR